MENSYKQTIMIDLDGVLNKYTKYEKDSIPEIREGAKEFLEKLSEDYELVLFTTRNMKMSVKWLLDNGIDNYFKDATNIKLPAYIYLDDRAVQFNGDYDEILKSIREFNVYWK